MRPYFDFRCCALTPWCCERYALLCSCLLFAAVFPAMLCRYATPLRISRATCAALPRLFCRYAHVCHGAHIVTLMFHMLWLRHARMLVIDFLLFCLRCYWLLLYLYLCRHAKSIYADALIFILMFHIPAVDCRYAARLCRVFFSTRLCRYAPCFDVSRLWRGSPSAYVVLHTDTPCPAVTPCWCRATATPCCFPRRVLIRRFYLILFRRAYTLLFPAQRVFLPRRDILFRCCCSAILRAYAAMPVAFMFAQRYRRELILLLYLLRHAHICASPTMLRAHDAPEMFDERRYAPAYWLCRYRADDALPDYMPPAYRRYVEFMLMLMRYGLRRRHFYADILFCARRAAQRMLVLHGALPLDKMMLPRYVCHADCCLR